MLIRLKVCVVLISLLATAGHSANLLPNPSFEAGRATPNNWSLFGEGNWEFNGYGSERCVSLTGNGNDVAWWSAQPGIIAPNQLFHVSYWARRRPETIGGMVSSGLDSLNQDAQVVLLTTEWEERGFFFRSPQTRSNAPFRLRQSQVTGTVYFDQASLTPALVVHRNPKGLSVPLGTGESIADGKYTAVHELTGPNSTDCRFLDHFTAAYSTDRWIFYGPKEVVYHHTLGRIKQAMGVVRVDVTKCKAGELLVEISTNGQAWTTVARINKVTTVILLIQPYHMPLPAEDVWIRLKSESNSSIEVSGYQYSCPLSDAKPELNLVGDSHYFDVIATSPDLDMSILDLGELSPNTPGRVEMAIRNKGPRRRVAVRLAIEKQGVSVSMPEEKLALPANSTRRVSLGYTLPSQGEFTVRISCVETDKNALLFEARGVVDTLRQ